MFCCAAGSQNGSINTRAENIREICIDFDHPGFALGMAVPEEASLLVDRTGRAGVPGAASFAGIDVPAISTALSERYVGESILIWQVVGIHTVADTVVRGDIEARMQDTGNSARRDVRHVIGNAATIRETGRITTQKAETPAIGGGRGWNASIEPQQVGNGTGRGSRRRNRGRVSNERQEVGAGRSRDPDSVDRVQNT